MNLQNGEKDKKMKTVLCSVMWGSEFSFLCLLAVTISVMFSCFPGFFSFIYGYVYLWNQENMTYYFPFGNGARAFHT